jgi:hypothetical protein
VSFIILNDRVIFCLVVFSIELNSENTLFLAFVKVS